jgi:hypothetical protein
MRFFPLLLLLAACSSLSYRSPGPYAGGALLGRGTYFAEIHLEPRGKQELRFNGIFAREPGKTLFSAVAPSGKPLFRVHDTLAPALAPAVRLLPTELPLTEAEASALYRGLRPLLYLVDDPARPQPLVRERYPDGRPRVIATDAGPPLTVDAYDWGGHAFRLSLAQDGWEARVVLREYEIGN